MDPSATPLTEPSQTSTPASVHAYDDPHITATAFLFAVMHDRDTPMRHRLSAAAKLLHLNDCLPRDAHFTYRIEGMTLQ